jgi:hypothetical protein
MPQKFKIDPWKSAFKSLLATLCIGFILFTYSETMFWGRPARAPLPELVVTWLVYSLMTYLFLAAMTVFRARGWAGLFLAGALYGWLGEGVLVQTMYDNFPVNLSWTGLAWHSLISVCAGWYGLSLALQRGAVPSALTAAGLGLFWGLWAVMWWQPEEGGRVTPLPAFAFHVFLQCALLALCYALYPRLLSAQSFTSKAAGGFILLVAALWFVFVAVPHTPLAGVVAPSLFALTLYALYRLRGPKDESGGLRTLRPLPWARHLAIFTMPLCATLVYALFRATGRTYPTNFWVYYGVMPLGFAAYAVGLWAAYRPVTLFQRRTTSRHGR